MICFDPSVNHKTLSCLLVRKEEFAAFLEENNLDVFWTELGEKQVLGGSMESNRRYNRLEISGTFSFLVENLEVSLQSEVRWV